MNRRTAGMLIPQTNQSMNVESVPPLLGGDYYPYGMIMAGRSGNSGQGDTKYKFTEKERDVETGQDWFEVRAYDSRIGMFRTVDPHADRYPSLSPYNYVGSNPMLFIDPTGKDSVYFQDRATRPADNGKKGTSYTATIYVVQGGRVVAVYENGGSTYPNSVSNTDNSTTSNTVNEGWHDFNNASGHDEGSKKGLNLVTANGKRESPGTTWDGNDITMTVVNIHEGKSNNGNYNSRGSTGCLTVNPDVAERFFGHFDWSGPGGTTGNSSGRVFITRGGQVPLPAQPLVVRSAQQILSGNR